MKHFIFLSILLTPVIVVGSVELIDFEISFEFGTPILHWITASETDNSHFDILVDGMYFAQIAGAGTTTEPQSYTYCLFTFLPAAFCELLAVDINGGEELLAAFLLWPSPAELLSFEAAGTSDGVEIVFVTSREEHNDMIVSFQIARRTQSEDEESIVASFPSQGETDSGWTYTYMDSSAEIGVLYYYSLTAIASLDWDAFRYLLARDTAMIVSQATLESVAQPLTISLSSYPNPFNPAATIKFELPVTAEVKLAVYNIQGQQVEELVNQRVNAGRHAVSFDGSNYPSGLYLARLQSGSQTKTRKLMLIK
ncbi:T9SS type A sorting domain-containing protein [bacterium]|nr:T9SS type A sorting domain-containing protein [bacterium]MBU1636982.1 T9SS type A sorting domain-containing protein [bacterium]MBU1921323.1 T9SS type A sorting domain-containing protein [bacterium]